MHDVAKNHDFATALAAVTFGSGTNRPSTLGGAINTISTGAKLNDFNLYRYVHNNPLIFADPTGQWPKWWDDFLEWLGLMKTRPILGGEFLDLLEATPELANVGTCVKIRQLWMDKEVNPSKYDRWQKDRIDQLYNCCRDRNR